MTRSRPANPRVASDSTASRTNPVSTCPSTSDWPSGPPAKSETYTVDEYIRLWEAKHCRKMTPEEKKTLARGCIGITALNLGKDGLPNPPLGNCYATFEQATYNAHKKLEKETGRKPHIFSKRFYSSGEEYTPDPKTGKVDMGGYRYKAKPGFVNFDYGFYRRIKRLLVARKPCGAGDEGIPQHSPALLATFAGFRLASILRRVWGYP